MNVKLWKLEQQDNEKDKSIRKIDTHHRLYENAMAFPFLFPKMPIISKNGKRIHYPSP